MTLADRCFLLSCSLSDGHLSESCVRDDHGVNKGSAAAHLPHLLRHAHRHGRLLRLPDQVSDASRSFPSSPVSLLSLGYLVFPTGQMQVELSSPQTNRGK